MAPQSYNWIFTCWHIDKINSLPEHVTYIYYGKETCPTTGKEHLQGYLCLKIKKSFSFLVKIFEGLCGDKTTFLEAMKGKLEHNTLYCGKDGQWTEFGVKPKTAKRIGQDNKEIFREIIKRAKAGDNEWLEEHEPARYTAHYRTLNLMRDKHLLSQNLENLTELNNLWIYGPTGTGKSRVAQQICERPNRENCYRKLNNKWWDGYKYQDNVLMEEVAPGMPMLKSFFKQWTDIYPFKSEHKGGSKDIRPKRIVVTSNYSMRECFPDDQDHNPMKRKMREVLMDNYDRPDNQLEIVETRPERTTGGLEEPLDLNAIAQRRMQERQEQTMRDQVSDQYMDQVYLID